MIQYLLDTNAFLRYLRKDVPQQTDRVIALFTQAKQSKILVTIPVAVILEVVFVLLKHYGEQKDAIGIQLFDLVSSPILDVENREIVKQALLIWKNSTISFVDCLVLAKARAEGKKLFTFDKKLQRLARNITP